MSRLRELKSGVSVDKLCSLFGKTRQAYSQSVNRACKQRLSEEIMLEIIMEIRTMMPRIGVRKLHKIINDRLPPELRIGRDALFDLMRNHGLLIQQRIRRVRSTYSTVTLDEVKKRVSEVVYIYNNKRPHLSLNYMTPKYVHENPDACIRPCWRNYYPKASQRVTVAMS